MRHCVVICAVFILSSSTFAQERHVGSTQPSQFEIARHTFFDFGPPTDYYELFLVRPTANGTSIERITLTPPGDQCMAPAKLETASGSLGQSVATLLGHTNPCTIPEKELRRELKRCKKCLVFTGAKVVMQIRCGTQTRLIRADILDKDMFDPAAHMPEHTSWTMSLLKSLDQAVGPGVMEKPIFAAPEKEQPSSYNPDSAALRDLSMGKYDALFQDAPNKPSDLYRAAQNPPPAPTVRMTSSTPIAPKVFVAPQYPVLARMVHVEGEVSFKLDIDANGNTINLSLDKGHPLLWGTAKQAASEWRFPKEAAGQQVQATIEFTLNCTRHTQ